MSTKRSLDGVDNVEAKPSKLSKAELYKPPTNEELNRLKETENLYQSSLFRMQIKELLSEVTVKDKRQREISAFVEKLATYLKNLPKGKEYDLMKQSWCDDITVPLDQSPLPSKGTYQFHAPNQVRVIGSFNQGTIVKPSHVDVAVQIPKICMKSSDFLNHRYHRKRALYLVSLCTHLRKSALVDSMQFSFLHGDRWKPVLNVTPSGNLNKNVVFIIHVCVEKSAFKLHRFHVCKNSIRQSWYKESEEKEGPETVDQAATPFSSQDNATPHYNTAVLHDLLMLRSANHVDEMLEDQTELKQGIVLLKVWLRQRGLNKIGGLSGHALTKYVGYLVKIRKITKLMSSYQVFRNTLIHLGSSTFEEGISLTDVSVQDDQRPEMEQFRRLFPLVFVDETGYLNIVSRLAPSSYNRIKQESKLAVTLLDEHRNDSFVSLFMTPMPFLHTFDYVFHISSVQALSECISRLDLDSSLMDLGGDYLTCVLPRLVEILSKALGQRVQLMDYCINDNRAWSVTENCPAVDEAGLSFGYMVDPDHYSTVLDKGPPADSSEAADFQQFWGDKSELRRFQDASICEAVVWSASTLADRRTVCMQIVKYVLQRHAGLDPNLIVTHCSKLDSLLQPAQKAHKPIIYGTGEEQTLAVLRAYDVVSKNLRKLRDLPLSIESVRGTSSIFSYSQVFPSVLHSKLRLDHAAEPLTKKGSPPTYSPCMEVVCAVEGSGKWPEDREAIRRLKAAFYIKMAASLTDDFSMTSQAYTDHLLTVQDGHVFSIVLALTREIAVMKMVHKDNGMLKMVETPEAVRLERDVIKLPLIRSALHAVQQAHNSFSMTVRLVKRWLSGQLLAGHLEEVAVELFVAYVYVHHSPYIVPRSGLTGFLRVLKLLTVWDWKMNPMIINFNNTLTSADYDEIELTFSKERSSLPLMYIVTSYDRRSAWTRQKPSVPILHRLVLLASQALVTLEKQCLTTSNIADFKCIFRPPLDVYNVLIHLAPPMLPRAHQAIDPPPTAVIPHLTLRVPDPKLLVTTAFDPVQCYLQELEACYGDVALFFHDQYGGHVIGVLWKPGAMEEKPFKVSNMNYHQINVDSTSDNSMLIPKVQTLINDFRILGRGLVKDITVQKR